MSHGANSCAEPPCFNPYWHGKLLEMAVQREINVVYYAYIIAFLAKQALGLNDCDVGSPSLCEQGALYVRENRKSILRTYSNFANETASRLGRRAEVRLFLAIPYLCSYS